MGKYMKKARGEGGAMEVLTQGQFGVRTRARTQAIEKIKELITSNSGNNKVSHGTSPTSLASAQISYLELRSRRLEKSVGKTVGCAGNKSTSPRKSTSEDECRRLSDLTNSDILVDDSCSRFALSAEESQRTHRHTKHGACDENREITYHFYGDNELDEELLVHGCISSLQQWGSRSRAPPSVAQSRSNSRSNSVTRELPPPTQELPPHGILTRNQRKMEKQFSEITACTNGVADMNAEPDLFCHANKHPASSNPNSCLDRHAGVPSCCASCNFQVEVSLREKPLDEGWFATRDRLTCEGTPISRAGELNTMSFSVRLLPEPSAHNVQAAPSDALSPLDMEIENFFLQAELQEQRRFIEQYNFDPVKDTPLPGRYDWVSL